MPSSAYVCVPVTCPSESIVPGDAAVPSPQLIVTEVPDLAHHRGELLPLDRLVQLVRADVAAGSLWAGDVALVGAGAP